MFTCVLLRVRAVLTCICFPIESISAVSAILILIVDIIRTIMVVIVINVCVSVFATAVDFAWFSSDAALVCVVIMMIGCSNIYRTDIVFLGLLLMLGLIFVGSVLFDVLSSRGIW